MRELRGHEHERPADLTGTRARGGGFGHHFAQVAGAITLLGTVLSAVVLVPPLLEPEYRCWDRTLAATLRDCPAPAGAAGLFWFYPSLDRSRDSCESIPPALAGKEATWVCPFSRAGLEGLLRYSAWPDPVSANRYYRDQFDRPGRIQHLDDQGVGYEWFTKDARTDQGFRFKRAGSFYKARFSWSVSASTPAGVDYGRSMIEIRDIAHWRHEGTESAMGRFLARLRP